jgi:HAD superfamily hydrolase (TIGR01509 family)
VQSLKIKGAIFDLDGTLLDSMHVWSEVDTQFLRKRGIAVPRHYTASVASFSFRETARYTIEQFDLDEDEDSIIAEWTAMSLDKYSSKVKLKAGAREHLEALKAAGIKLATATSILPELYEPVLRNNGIYGLFDAHTFTHEAGRSKSFPDVYLLAAERLGVEPCSCVVYEDLIHGIQSAANAGFYTVAVEDYASAHIASEIKTAAHLYITSFSEMRELPWQQKN